MAKQVKKNPMKAKPKKKSVKQGHKLVWFTLIVILIPVAIIGWVLLTSIGGQGEPVLGNRFDTQDLNPSITDQNIEAIEASVSQIGGVEKASVNLLSATLRVHLDISDDANADGARAILDAAYSSVAQVLPIETYFTNTDEAKMYDLEIDVYNYIVDESHPAESQVYLKTTKTGAGAQVVENLTQAKDPDLVNSLQRS